MCVLYPLHLTQLFPYNHKQPGDVPVQFRAKHISPQCNKKVLNGRFPGELFLGFNLALLSCLRKSSHKDVVNVMAFRFRKKTQKEREILESQTTGDSYKIDIYIIHLNEDRMNTTVVRNSVTRFPLPYSTLCVHFG